MYLYNIGYYSYEESNHTQLQHNRKFSQKEFEDMIINEKDWEKDRGEELNKITKSC